MNLLAIDTSSEWLSIALARGDALAVHHREAGQAQGDTLLPTMLAMLGEAKLAVGDLDAIAYGAGPGAFAGLRIACGVAQGLALADGLPLAAIGSFETIAEAVRDEHPGAVRVWVAIDARMGELYHCALERDGEAWRRVTPGCVTPVAALARPPGSGWIAAGSGFGAHAGALAPLLAGGFEAVLPSARPHAAAMLRLARRAVAAGETLDAAAAAPVYLRDRVALTTVQRAAGERLQPPTRASGASH